MDSDTDLQEEFQALVEEYKDDTPTRFIRRPEVRALMWDKSLGKCWYCSRELNPFRDFSIDHIVSRIEGGEDSYQNLVPCCRQCNYSKGNRTLEEFRATMAKRAGDCPGFTLQQMAWLKEQGVKLPLLSVSEFQFYFEKEGLE